MTKLESALALAAQGFKIFPLAPGTKGQPLLAQWPQLATSDPKLVALQWGPTGTPDANIGIHATGMIVLDIDVKKGGNESLQLLELTYGLPQTYTVETATGGRHVYYRADVDVPNGVDVLGRGIDVRSGGGYVVGPGSAIGTASYRVAVDSPVAAAPNWLATKLGRAAVKKGPTASVDDAPEVSVERAAGWLRTAERSVKGQGGDQAAFRVACALRDLGVSYQQACELMRSEAWDYGCGWRDGWLEAKPIRSAYTYAQNEAGGGRGVVEDDLPLPQPDAPAAAQLATNRVVRADAWRRTAGPAYVLKNLLSRSSHALAYGPPGAGKTFVLLDIGYHVANAKAWMGCNVHGGPVLYLAYEGIGGLGKRIRALQKHYGDDLGPLYMADASRINLREQAGRQELGRVLADMPTPVLIIIDTFAHALCGGDENSAQDVGALTSAITALIRSTSACVLVVHHSGKDAAKGARGSSAILGALDTEIAINFGAVKPTKQRDLELLPALPFVLRPVVIGIDEDNEEEQSCVVQVGQTLRSGKPLTGKAEHAFNILNELTGPENNPVSKARWIAKMTDEGLGRSSAYNWPRKLEMLQLVMIEDDYVRRRLA